MHGERIKIIKEQSSIQYTTTKYLSTRKFSCDRLPVATSITRLKWKNPNDVPQYQSTRRWGKLPYLNVCFIIKCLTLFVLKLEAHKVSNKMSVYNTGAYSLFSEIVNNFTFFSI